MTAVAAFVRAFEAEFSDPTPRALLIAAWRRQLLPHIHPGSHLVPTTIRVHAAPTLALATSFVVALQSTPLALARTNKALSLFPQEAHVPPIALSDLSPGLREACPSLVRATGVFSQTSNFVSRFSASGFAHNSLLEVVFPRETLLMGLVLAVPELRDVWWHRLPPAMGPTPPRAIGAYIRQVLVLDTPPFRRRDTGQIRRYAGRDPPPQFNVFRSLRRPPAPAGQIPPCRRGCPPPANPVFTAAAAYVRARGLPFWATMSHLLSSLVLRPTRDPVSAFVRDGTAFGRRVSWGPRATGYLIESDIQKAICILHAAALRLMPRRAYLYPLALAVARQGIVAGHCAVASWLAGTAGAGHCPPSHVSVASIDGALLDAAASTEGAPRDLVLLLPDSPETPLAEYVVSYEATGEPLHLGNLRVCVSSTCDFPECDWDAFASVGWG